MQPDDPNFHPSLAGPAETGRPCPYCRFPLKEGIQIVVCGVCGAPHHADCWNDNRGCAVIACAGGPTEERAGGADTPTPTIVHPAAAAAGPARASEPTAPLPWPTSTSTSSGERRGPSLAVAVIVLALAVAGAAVAIVVSGQSNGSVRLANNATSEQTVSAPAVTTSTAASAETTSTEEETDTTSTVSAEGLLPAVSSEQMQSEIQHVLLEWHEDVVNGDDHAAWELLSQRKQAQDGREYGYATWAKNQATLRPYLSPSGLQVTVEHTEPSSGVAQVNVTGMGWNKPGASCTEWSGITWVKYENGAWRYDPGYSTTLQREHEWKPRYSELLGGRC